MFATTTALAALASAYGDTGTMVIYIVGVILGGLIALLGLGFADLASLPTHCLAYQNLGGCDVLPFQREQFLLSQATQRGDH